MCFVVLVTEGHGYMYSYPRIPWPKALKNVSRVQYSTDYMPDSYRMFLTTATVFGTHFLLSQDPKNAVSLDRYVQEYRSQELFDPISPT
jgi:hypothetical protein